MTLTKRVEELEAENAAFHSDGLKVYGTKVQLLSKRVKELEALVREAIDTMEDPSYRKVDDWLKRAREAGV